MPVMSTNIFDSSANGQCDRSFVVKRERKDQTVEELQCIYR